MIWLIGLFAIVAVIVGGALATTRMRSASLKRRFGSEYDRVLEQEGDRHNAEAVLRQRAKQRDAPNDQRQAFQDYRSLFDELLVDGADSAQSATEHVQHNVS